jgi:hypothetical protein
MHSQNFKLTPLRRKFLRNNKRFFLLFRCQSLLHLKLYKLRKHDMRECQQKLEDLLNNASKKTANSETSPVGNGLSPTPSPAGSEGSVCSKSSGYTSAGELPGPILSAARPGGVLTPPTPSSSLMGGTMSVPHTLMHKQYRYSNFLTQCHELWEMADLFTHRGHCSGNLTEKITKIMFLLSRHLRSNILSVHSYTVLVFKPNI